MIIKSVEQAPNECNHIIITTDTGEVITTTKDEFLTFVKSYVENANSIDWMTVSDIYNAKVIK